jgi:hypothetical protein
MISDPATRQVAVARVALVVGVVFAAGLVSGLALVVPEHTFSGRAEGFGCNEPCYLPVLPDSIQHFPDGAWVSFSWGDSNGTTGALTFSVAGPLGTVLTQTGTGGSDSFVSTGGDYQFAIHAADHQGGYLYANYAGTG